MAVYVDNFNIRADVPNGSRVHRGVWCHMTADTREELDAMAVKIGLRKSYIQKPGTWHEHYDVTLSKRRLAVAAGAIEVDIREHLRKMRAMFAARTSQAIDRCDATWTNSRDRCLDGSQSHACSELSGHGGSHPCECGDRLTWAESVGMST